MWGFFVVLGLGVVLMVGMIVAVVIANKRKREAMEALAAKHGWRLHRKDRSMHEMWDQVAPFDFGHSKRSDWIFDGEVDGQRFTVFQYTCQTTSHNGKSSSEQTHHYRVCVIPMPLDGHDLRITKEHIGLKIADALGGEDIDFESDAFSRRFWVKCRDRRFAYDVLTPAMMEYLLPHKNWHWHWVGQELILHRAGGLKVDHVEPMIRLAHGFAARLPRHRLATP